MKAYICTIIVSMGSLLVKGTSRITFQCKSYIQIRQEVSHENIMLINL